MPVIVVNPEHSLNIKEKFWTLFGLNLDKSREVSPLSPLNILSIYMAELVSHELMPVIVVNSEHSWNIEEKNWTFFRAKLDKSSFFKLESWKNIWDTEVALLPIHWLKSPTLDKAVQSANIYEKSVARLGLNLAKSSFSNLASSLNILETFVALLPVHWLKSPTLDKAVQPANIYEKSVARLGLNLVKSSFSNLASSLNI